MERTDYPREDYFWLWDEDVEHLYGWLRDTDQGKAIIRELAPGFLEEACRKCQRLRPYSKVLAVVRLLGCRPGVEVFYERGVTVKCIELVDSQDDPATEILVEELLEHQLPRLWKPLVQCRSDSQVFTGLTAEWKLQMIEVRDWLHLMTEFKKAEAAEAVQGQ